MADRKAANGSGSVYKRKDGRWSGAIYVTESDGRRVRRTVYGRTRREAESKLIEIRSKAEAGAPIAPNHLTLEKYLREWLDQIVAQRVRPNTLVMYRLNVDKYLVPGLGKTKLGRLTARDVRKYLDELRQQGIGPRTIRYAHATLRAALEDAVREEILEKNVAKLVRAPSAPRKERQPLTIDEVRTLLHATRDDRLHALYVCLALLGLRRSEALGLQWSDVDLVERTLTVRHGLHRAEGRLQLLDPKTARSRRTIPLPGLVVDALIKHLETQQGEQRDLGSTWPVSSFVFTTSIGTPIDPDNCSKLVKAAVEAAGLRSVGMHDFRHGCVSVLLALGVPPRTVMEIAGHSALEMTMNVYAHVSLGDKKEALDRLGELFVGRQSDYG